MKFNKWTLGLAAVGVVSLASAAQAQDTANTVLTALSATTISGYVDTSAQWNFGTGNAYNPPYKFGGANKADGFNLDVVQLSIAKPLDESEWAAGYRVDLWFGPDANTLGTQAGGTASDFAIRQAYVALRTPVGNGIDWKIGVFDSIIGYESVASPNDPNYTRSYGHSIEPQTHTGILGTYRFCDTFSASFGIANTMNSAINSRATAGSTGTTSGAFAQYGGLFGYVPPANGVNPYAESYKTYMGSIAITAPDTMGFLSGSTLYGGVENGYNNSVLGSGAGLPQLNAYVGATIATPVTGLRLGAAYDLLIVNSPFTGVGQIKGDIWSLAGYASWQATEKLSFHERLEYVDGTLHDPVGASQTVFAWTTTLQYDLWKNVLSRVEFRWDHSANDQAIFGGTGGTSGTGPNRDNAYMLAANIIYKF